MLEKITFTNYYFHVVSFLYSPLSSRSVGHKEAINIYIHVPPTILVFITV